MGTSWTGETRQRIYWDFFGRRTRERSTARGVARSEVQELEDRLLLSGAIGEHDVMSSVEVHAENHNAAVFDLTRDESPQLSPPPIYSSVLPSDNLLGLTFYLAVNGDDSNDGLSPNSALKTLSAANLAIRAATYYSPQNVTLKIGPGTYRAQTVNWTWSMAGHSINIEALDPEKRPIFDGCATTCESSIFFQLT